MKERSKCNCKFCQGRAERNANRAINDSNFTDLELRTLAYMLGGEVLTAHDEVRVVVKWEKLTASEIMGEVQAVIDKMKAEQRTKRKAEKALAFMYRYGNPSKPTLWNLPVEHINLYEAMFMATSVNFPSARELKPEEIRGIPDPTNPAKENKEMKSTIIGRVVDAHYEFNQYPAENVSSLKMRFFSVIPPAKKEIKLTFVIDADQIQVGLHGADPIQAMVNSIRRDVNDYIRNHKEGHSNLFAMADQVGELLAQLASAKAETKAASLAADESSSVAQKAIKERDELQGKINLFDSAMRVMHGSSTRTKEARKERDETIARRMHRTRSS